KSAANSLGPPSASKTNVHFPVIGSDADTVLRLNSRAARHSATIAIFRIFTFLFTHQAFATRFKKRMLPHFATDAGDGRWRRCERTGRFLTDSCRIQDSET